MAAGGQGIEGIAGMALPSAPVAGGLLPPPRLSTGRTGVQPQPRSAVLPSPAIPTALPGITTSDAGPVVSWPAGPFPGTGWTQLETASLTAPVVRATTIPTRSSDVVGGAPEVMEPGGVPALPSRQAQRDGVAAAGVVGARAVVLRDTAACTAPPVVVTPG